MERFIQNGKRKKRLYNEICIDIDLFFGYKSSLNPEKTYSGLIYGAVPYKKRELPLLKVRDLVLNEEIELSDKWANLIMAMYNQSGEGDPLVERAIIDKYPQKVTLKFIIDNDATNLIEPLLEQGHNIDEIYEPQNTTLLPRRGFYLSGRYEFRRKIQMDRILFKERC